MPQAYKDKEPVFYKFSVNSTFQTPAPMLYYLLNAKILRLREKLWKNGESRT